MKQFEFSTVNINELKEDEALSVLVPEMSADEYERFIESIKKSGVQTPIHIRNDMIILDGRHRVRACKQLGITKIETLVHDFNKAQSIEFVRDTAIERRNLTKAQRIDIVLKSVELIKALEEKAKRNQLKGTSSPAGEKVNTNKKIANLANSSMNQVLRMKKIKKEAPEIYDEVVKGEKSTYRAYQELPTVTPDKKRSEYPSGKSKKSNIVPINIPKPMTPDETKMLMAVENLDLNFNQIIHYVANNGEKLYDAICQTYEERPEFMEKAYIALQRLVNLMDAYQGGKENDKTI